jgi:hypothetical protein
VAISEARIPDSAKRAKIVQSEIARHGSTFGMESNGALSDPCSRQIKLPFDQAAHKPRCGHGQPAATGGFETIAHRLELGQGARAVDAHARWGVADLI